MDERVHRVVSPWFANQSVRPESTQPKPRAQRAPGPSPPRASSSAPLSFTEAGLPQPEKTPPAMNPTRIQGATERATGVFQKGRVTPQKYGGAIRNLEADPQ